MRFAVFVLLSIVLALVFFGCTQNDNAGVISSQSVSQKCVNACLLEKDKASDLSAGPCLGLIATDWVCDVAHNPRRAVDNLQENQCADFRNGVARHFVEVDKNCKVISAN